ncbi:MAG TPA: hypothetical protein VHB51_01205 [Candidatus Saccharimonadales bacterium]|nr:hypothetical protein [Candidatus Saccharimonadales bacterium]
MIATQKTLLYNKVVEITQDFLGPASEQFITRQIKAHLNKDPEDLRPKDLEELSRWIKISIALLTEDGKMVESYASSIMALAKKPSH